MTIEEVEVLVKQQLEHTIEDFEFDGMYVPLMEQYPIHYGDSLSEYMKNVLAQAGSPACADDNGIYVDIELTASFLKKLYEDNSVTLDSYNIRQELKTIIAHEYTHILCGHTSMQGKYKDPTSKYRQRIAFEIQANRGYMVDRSALTERKAEGVINDDKYPTTKGMNTLDGIYKELCNIIKDKDIEDVLDGLQEESTDGDGNGSDGEGTGDKPNGEDKGNGSDKGKGKSELGKQIKNVMGDATLSQADEDTQQGSQQSSGTDSGKDDTKHNAIKSKGEQSDGKDKQNEETMRTSTYQMICDGLGGTATEKEFEQASPQDKLRMIRSHYEAKQVAKSLERIRGCLAGTVSKGKTATYSRQSRKQSGDGLLRKGVKRDKRKVPKVLVALDCSGSMSATTIQTVARAIEGIVKTLGKGRQNALICLHREYCSEVYPLSKWDTVIKNYVPNGGNDFHNVWEVAKRHHCDTVLNVGDGQCYLCATRCRGEITRPTDDKIKWCDVVVIEQRVEQVKQWLYKNLYEEDKKYGWERELIYLGADINRINKALKEIH